MLTLCLKAVPKETIMGPLPARGRFVHVDVYDKWLAISHLVIISDMYRSADSSLLALQTRKGAQPPGKSGHGFGRCIDLDQITKILKSPEARAEGIHTKLDLDVWMAGRDWWCHRKDHLLDHEAWHYNCIPGEYLRDSDKYTSSALERYIQDYYGLALKLNAFETQVALASLKLYGGEIDGKLGRLSKQALMAFQRTWRLQPTGTANAATQRVLAFVTATKEIVP